MRLKYLIWTILVLLTASCQSEQGQQQRVIEELENTLAESTDAEKAKVLIDGYVRYASSFPGDHEMNSKYLYRAAAWAYRLNQFSQAIELLNRALKDNYQGSNTVNNALLLGAIYKEKLQNEFLSRTVFQATHQVFPESEEVAGKIDEQWLPLEERLRSLQLSIFDQSGSRIDYRKANDFINSATIYAMLLPRHRDAAGWLFEAAETARTIRAFSKALDLYAWITDHFPDSDKAAQALFLQGFTLDSDLKRYDEARLRYEDFLIRHPDDIFAKDAKFLLETLGKDEEEIIRSFEEKNQLQNS